MPTLSPADAAAQGFVPLNGGSAHTATLSASQAASQGFVPLSSSKPPTPAPVAPPLLPKNILDSQIQSGIGGDKTILNQLSHLNDGGLIRSDKFVTSSVPGATAAPDTANDSITSKPLTSPSKFVPRNAAQAGGAITTDLAEFALPAGDITKASDAAKAAVKFPGLLGKAAGVGAKAAVTGTANAGISYSQNQNAKSAGIIGGTAGALDAAITVATPIVKAALAARRAASAAADAKAVDNLAGQIVQGRPEDIAKAKTSLSSIDVSGVKTYTDLTSHLDDKIANLSNKLTDTLATDKTVKPLQDLALTSKAGDTSVSHNFVQDGLTQLADHYKAINDVVGASKIEQLQSKATTEGLSITDINNLAKEHGQQLNAFNANGQAASGLAKQAAENTRTGIKSTARDIFRNPVYDATDKAISSLIRTRDLVQKVADNVNQLQQKIKTRTWGERAGRLVAEVVNLVGLNSPKGFVEYFLSRGTGLKTLNALDLEAVLSKNLRNLQDALKPGQPEATIESKLQAIIDQSKTASPLPAKNLNSDLAPNATQPTTPSENIPTKKSNIPNTLPPNPQSGKGSLKAVAGAATALTGTAALGKAAISNTVTYQRPKSTLPVKTAQVSIPEKTDKGEPNPGFIDNNPGNLRYAGQPGATRSPNNFAKFENPQDGYRALLNQVKVDAARGLSIKEFAEKYAPKSDGNDTKAYMEYIASELNTTTAALIKDISPDKLARIIAKRESGTTIE